MKTYISGILFSLSSLIIFSQTYFEGGIYNHTTWTYENSPYIITGDVAVFPDYTLTIESGVKILFDSVSYFEIRGSLIVNGDTNNYIEFNNYNNSAEDKWIGIKYQDNPNSKIRINYCFIKNAQIGINAEGILCTDSVILNNTIIDSCEIGFQAYTTPNLFIYNSNFSNNEKGINGDFTTPINTTFTNNTIGIIGGDMTITNCSFSGNDYGIFDDFGLISANNCIFTENDVAIRTKSTKIIDSEIQYNRIGIIMESNSITDENSQKRDNKICYNNEYNVEMKTAFNQDLKNNCFCTSDSAEIEELIYDGYDDITVGLINYSIYDNSCDTRLKSVIKHNNNFFTSVNGNKINNSSINIYYNNHYKYILLKNRLNKELNLKIQLYNICGQLVYSVNHFNVNHELYIPLSGEVIMTNGIYILKVTEIFEGTILVQKIMTGIN